MAARPLVPPPPRPGTPVPGSIPYGFGAPYRAGAPYGDVASNSYGAPYGFVRATPPRPRVLVGASLLLVGSIVAIVGCHLPWLRINLDRGTESVNAFTELLRNDEPAGSALVLFAIVTGAMGITQLAARRVLSVAVIAVVFASMNALFAIVAISDIGDFKRLFAVAGRDTSWSVGPFVVVIGMLAALGGAIGTLSKRRR